MQLKPSPTYQVVPALPEHNALREKKASITVKVHAELEEGFKVIHLISRNTC
jgi:hypothetical protein